MPSGNVCVCTYTEDALCIWALYFALSHLHFIVNERLINTWSHFFWVGNSMIKTIVVTGTIECMKYWQLVGYTIYRVAPPWRRYVAQSGLFHRSPSYLVFSVISNSSWTLTHSVPAVVSTVLINHLDPYWYHFLCTETFLVIIITLQFLNLCKSLSKRKKPVVKELQQYIQP